MLLERVESIGSALTSTNPKERVDALRSLVSLMQNNAVPISEREGQVLSTYFMGMLRDADSTGVALEGLLLVVNRMERNDASLLTQLLNRYC